MQIHTVKVFSNPRSAHSYFALRAHTHASCRTIDSIRHTRFGEQAPPRVCRIVSALLDTSTNLNLFSFSFISWHHYQFSFSIMSKESIFLPCAHLMMIIVGHSLSFLILGFYIFFILSA